MSRQSISFFLVLVVLVLFLPVLSAQPAHPTVPLAAQPSAQFNARAATDAWLATVTGTARARSDAYFEGGYWLILWDFLWGTAVLLLLLETRLSGKMRNLAERLTRFQFLQIIAYWVQFSLVTAVLTFPLTLYEGFFREQKYGLMNQTFGGWFRDQLIALGLSLVFGGLLVAALIAIVRRLPRTWHLWGTAVAIVFLVFGAAIAPVFIAPLFNTYKPLANTPIKQQILSLAHANGIPASDVYEVDASKQSNRVSANVSGLFGTERITLNDNLLKRVSPEGILSTMGHEMGHYVLHHINNAVIFFTLLAIIFFALLRGTLAYSLTRWGARWQIRDVGDVAVLPLAVLILSIFGFVFTPVANSFTRTQEFEADMYGINAARQPDGEAEVDLLLGEYRKLDPGPLEEILFFDHPAGRTRIYAAMRWKAENLCLFDASLPCAESPSH
jgi:STE24 endopeptidase